MVFILLDVAVILCAYGMAEAASLLDRAPADYLHKLVLFLAVTLTVQLIANWCFGLYGRIWRHAGIEEARNIVLSCLATLCVLTALYPLGFAEGITRVPFLVLPLGLSPDDAGDRRAALPLPAPRLAAGEPGHGSARRRHRQRGCWSGRRTGHAPEPVRRPLPRSRSSTTIGGCMGTRSWASPSSDPSTTFRQRWPSFRSSRSFSPFRTRRPLWSNSV